MIPRILTMPVRENSDCSCQLSSRVVLSDSPNAYIGLVEGKKIQEITWFNGKNHVDFPWFSNCILNMRHMNMTSQGMTMA